MTLEQVKTLVDTLSDAEKHELVEYISNIPIATSSSKTVRLTASELMKLPYEERQRRFAESAALSANEDFEIFDAYSEEDIDSAYDE